jgi:hypothetical protein
MMDIGWGGDHVGKLSKLRTAVRMLAEGRGKTAERLEKSTYALIGLRPTDFPDRIRNLANRALSLRGKYVFHAGDSSYFHYVAPGDKVRFANDLIALYEACLIDLGRTWPQWDFMYPEDIDAPPKRKKGHSGSAKAK